MGDDHNNQTSRRDFLKLAALGTAGLAGAALGTPRPQARAAWVRAGEARRMRFSANLHATTSEFQSGRPDRKKYCACQN
ncbi:MAG: twin-arginine translocation signal domain-containing protein [Candidatus Adiutrix sp.]|jgi:anaerobic selenocysteine-containing dehydrogenase|nr:twin-arginine translocation signal domain-containing protein [Candidatus Adiutrix sp.]